MNIIDIKHQEQKCIEVSIAIDFLLTRLFELDEFSDYKYWKNKLNRLKKEINRIYWDL